MPWKILSFALKRQCGVGFVGICEVLSWVFLWFLCCLFVFNKYLILGFLFCYVFLIRCYGQEWGLYTELAMYKIRSLHRKPVGLKYVSDSLWSADIPRRVQAQRLNFLPEVFYFNSHPKIQHPNLWHLTGSVNVKIIEVQRRSGKACAFHLSFTALHLGFHVKIVTL